MTVLVFIAGLVLPAFPSAAAHRPSEDLAVIEEEYEEEEYVLDEATEYSEEYSSESLMEYRAPLYRQLPGDFLYPRLPEDEKTVYAALWTGAQEPEKDAYVAFETYSCTAGDKTEAREQDPMSAEERSRAACALLFDHPEIYWSQNIRLLYSYVIKGSSYTVTVKIKLSLPSGTDFSAGKDRLRDRAQSLLSEIDRSASQAVVALKVHDALVSRVAYDYDDVSLYGHSAYGALVEGAAVCDGYAKAYKYLLDLCGIESSVVSSYVHAWNILCLEGRYYETDATWDDVEACMNYYDLSTAQMDDGFYHSRNNAGPAAYLPKAEGGKYTGHYMSFCGKSFEQAGPTGDPASLTVISGAKDDDAWTLDLLDAEGSSLRRSIHRSESSSDAFRIEKELSRESGMEAGRIYGIRTGTYDIETRVLYDNGAVSSFRADLAINGKVHTQSLTLSPASAAMERGRSQALSLKLNPEDATDAVEWSSSAPEVVSVDGNGNITALAKGSAVITAASNGHRASCSVTVKVTPSGLSLPGKMDLLKGKTALMEASVLPEGAAASITWTSSNKKIATVSSDGRVKAVSAGTCTVTGTVKGTAIKASCSVRVLLSEPQLQDPAVTSSGITLTWKAVSGASAYRVYRKTDGGSWTARTVTTKKTWSDTSVVSGKHYAYAVACLASDKKKELSTYGSSPVETYFYSPVKVTLSNTAAGLAANWNALPDITAYRVYYASGSSWKKVCDTEGTSYTFTGLASGTTRKVRVRALRDGEPVSGSSNTPSLKFIKAPDVKSLSIVSSKKIKITWNKSAGAAKYRVYCKEDDGQWKKLSDTSSLSYTWSSARAGKTYTFRICCVSGNGKTLTSACGAEKSIQR